MSDRNTVIRVVDQQQPPRPYAQAARTYRDLGWEGVIPVDLDKDKPGVVPPGTTGRNGSAPEDEEVRAWTDTHGARNLGLRLPDDVIGIDVDCYDGKAGCETLMWWETNAGLLPATWSSTSRHDGSRILFYRVLPGRKWITELPHGRFGIDGSGGVEIVQHTHRWARVWPSLNPKTGQPYRWEDPTGNVSDLPPGPDDLAELPDAWVEALSSGRSSRISASPIADTPTGDLLAGVPEGERHNRLVQVAGRLWTQTGDREVVRVQLLYMARNCRPPHDEQDVADIVEWVVEQPRGSFDLAEDLEAWARSVTASSASEERPRLVGGGDFALDEPAQVPAVWGTDERVLWAEGEPFMVAAPQGTGKTTIAQQLVLHRLGVRQDKLLGLPVEPLAPDRTVLYLAMDRPRQAARSMRRMLRDDDRAEVNARLLVWRGPLPFDPVKEPRRLAAWVSEVGEGRVGVVVVDSVKDLAPGIVQDEMGSALNLGWQALVADGVELALLHHHRKAQQGKRAPHTLDDVYGSAWLTAGCGSVVTLVGEPGDPTVDMKHLKIPSEPVGPLVVRHDHAAGRSHVRNGKVDVADVLREHGDVGATVEELAHAVYGRASEKERKRVERALRKLQTDQLARQEKGVVTSEGKQPARWFDTPQAQWSDDR